MRDCKKPKLVYLNTTLGGLLSSGDRITKPDQRKGGRRRGQERRGGECDWSGGRKKGVGCEGEGEDEGRSKERGAREWR